MQQLLLLHLFFVIYGQIMSGLVTLLNFVLGYIQIPLKEFLDLPLDKNYSRWFVTAPSPALTSQELHQHFSTDSRENY